MARVTNEDLAGLIGDVRDDVADVKNDLKEMNGRQRADHDKIMILEERLSTSSRAQTAFTAVASAVAAGVAALIGINR